MQTFSLTQILVTAITTFILSGLGGALFVRYLSRGRPIVSVTSVGFSGDVIHLSEEAIDASAADSWGPPLNGFVSYDTALTRDGACSKLILELGKVKNIVDDWLSQNVSEDSTQLLTKAQLKSCPYFSFSHVGSSILGKLKRRNMPDLPVPKNEVEKEARKYDLDKRKDAWVLHLGERGILFPIHEVFSEKETNQQELIAESFSRGILRNIRLVMQTFSSSTADELNKLRTLQNELRKCIPLNANLVIEASVTNLGDRPITLSPYCITTLGLGEDSVSIILKTTAAKPQAEPTEPNNPVDLLARAVGKKSSDRGEMFAIEPFLAKAGSSPYITVPGGGTTNMMLVSTEKLGGLGEKLVKHYELGTLTCRLMATKAVGGKVFTPKVTFGKELSEHRKQQLLSVDSR
ncbi:hypothetical protein [Methylophilus sp. YYY-1]|uniref:hypothetical protein n=1 Tax=Methylophilus sp. YYY-1 TaxID=2682087 RepID=UPI0023B28BD9|nr:hypothetical protein [Methylophilus sp. YYY-1]MDF0378793.1 hypothetical protein [Methylophilus sp. YYY-1]